MSADTGRLASGIPYGVAGRSGNDACVLDGGARRLWGVAKDKITKTDEDGLDACVGRGCVATPVVPVPIRLIVKLTFTYLA